MMKNEPTVTAPAPTRYRALRNLNVRDPKTGRTKAYAVGQVISAAAWGQLSSTSRSQFEPVASRRVSRAGAAASQLVPDAAVLAFFRATAARDEQLLGSYSDVWAQVALELGVVAPFCHFRATQIARVGRAFERAEGYSFRYLCPELDGSDWVSDLG
jgi:hypothetical protein